MIFLSASITSTVSHGSQLTPAAAHVDSAYPYGPPNVDEFHVTAQRWDGLVPAICAVMADVLGRPVKYRIGNESLIVKPPTNSFPVPLSVTVVQRVHGSADLHRGACSCDGCYSPRSSISSGSSCTIGRSTASADDDIADDDRGAGSSGSTPSRASQESSGGKRSRRSKPRSFFAFGGDNRLSQRRTRARAHEPTSQDDTSSTLSPPPASPHSPASSTSLAASQTPPTSYLSPHLASTLKSSPPAATA